MHRITWERLDSPGHDSCRFLPTDTGWTIAGAAVFDRDGAAAALAYRIDCDGRWHSERAEVMGWIGASTFALRLERIGTGSWRLNGEEAAALEGLFDIDLGFTPASNTNALRRLALGDGAAAETTALWLDAEDWQVKPLPQSYRRLSAERYAYASPMHDYSATLQVDDFAAVTDYPGLWRALPQG